MHPFDELGEVAVIDCETTGLSPKTDRIISVGVVLADLQKDVQESKTMELMVNPGVPIPEDATRVHGIRDADVLDCRSFGEIAKQLTKFIADRPLVGFNVSFDKQFINAELKRHGFKTFHRKRSYCVMNTLQMSWGYRPTLENAIKRLSVERSGDAHNALNDALATANLAAILSRMPEEDEGHEFISDVNDYQSQQQTETKSTAKPTGCLPIAIVAVLICVVFVAVCSA